MTTTSPRAWLHALEDQPLCPAGALQVARIYADFAAAATGTTVWVSWEKLRHCTHQSLYLLAKSVSWLRDQGWLVSLPWRNGQRRKYVLAVPEPLWRPECDRSGVQSGTTLASRARTPQHREQEKRPTLRVVSSR